MNYLRTVVFGVMSSCSRNAMVTKHCVLEDSETSHVYDSDSNADISPCSYEFVENGVSINKQRKYDLRPRRPINYTS